MRPHALPPREHRAVAEARARPRQIRSPHLTRLSVVVAMCISVATPPSVPSIDSHLHLPPPPLLIPATRSPCVPRSRATRPARVARHVHRGQRQGLRRHRFVSSGERRVSRTPRAVLLARPPSETPVPPRHLQTSFLPTTDCPNHASETPAPFPQLEPLLKSDAKEGVEPSGAGSDGSGPPKDDPGDVIFGLKLGFDGVFAVLALLTVVLISASCYFEEWMYKRLPNFNYFWTVACAELAVFTVASVAGAVATGTIAQPRRAPFLKYLLQATVMAVYAAIAKIAYKYLNYATGTVLRSTSGVRHGHQRGVAGARSSWDAFGDPDDNLRRRLWARRGARGQGPGSHLGYVLSVLGLGLAACRRHGGQRDGPRKRRWRTCSSGSGFGSCWCWRWWTAKRRLCGTRRTPARHREVADVLPRRVRSRLTGWRRPASLRGGGKHGVLSFVAFPDDKPFSGWFWRVS